MKLIAAHVFEARGIGRAAEESREVLDPLHVVMLGLRRELADRHVFDHALPQRAYGLIGHEGCSCLDEGCEPLISRQDAPSCYRVGCVVRRGALPRERFSPVARSGHLWIGTNSLPKESAALERNMMMAETFSLHARYHLAFNASITAIATARGKPRL